MDAIARGARVTKPTVYAHFGSKEGLFEALLRSALEQLIETPVSAVSTSEQVEQALIDHATQQIDMMLDETVLGLLRAASSEGTRRPEWAQQLIASLGTSEFEIWLDTVRKQGLLAFDSAADAVEQFWALIKGVLFYPVVIGVRAVPTPAERRRVISGSVRTFLAAYAIEASERIDDSVRSDSPVGSPFNHSHTIEGLK